MAPTGPLRFNSHFSSLPAYNAGLSLREARRLGHGSRLARLASNENPYGCSPRVLAAIGDIANEPWRYPEADSATLRDALAIETGHPVDQISVGNGSEMLIAAICRAFLEPGDRVLTTTPGFGLHVIEPRACGAQVTTIAHLADFAFDIDGLVEALALEPRLFFLASPSNPVGTIVSKAEFERLLAAVRPGTLFVFDEAYFEFVAEDIRFDGSALAATAGVNFVSLRTFSKAYGLAGLRTGYGLASSRDITTLIQKALTPFNVNGLAQAAALAALADGEWMEAHIQKIVVERRRLDAGLRALGYAPAPSHGNFLFVGLGSDSLDAAADLLRQGVVIKPWREPGYENFVRVTVGLAEDTDQTLAAFARLTRPRAAS